MNYLILWITYLLLMGLGRILLFVEAFYLLYFISIIIYTPFVHYLYHQKKYQKYSLLIHAINMIILQSVITTYHDRSLITTYYVCFVSVICIWMYDLEVQYADLCQNR